LKCPRLSAHLLVRGGAAVLERALRPLAGVVDEVCFTDTGSTDGTPDLVVSLCREIGASCGGVCITPLSRPDLYFPDLPSSFNLPLMGAFSGLPLLRDWSAARNLSLSLCRGKYVLKIDADDEVMAPRDVPRVLDYLDANPGVDFLTSPYEVVAPGGSEVESVTQYTRLWRNLPSTRFREACHENVDWCRRPDGSNWREVRGGLVVRDWRDSPGVGTRVEGRNFKVLLREYERFVRAAEPPGPHLLVYLATEAVSVDPLFALEVSGQIRLDLCLPADAAWVTTTRGEALAALGHQELAADQYRQAAEGGHGRAQLLLAMVRAEVRRGGWRAELQAAIYANEGRPYPRWASLSELRRAKKMLEETP
jgi:glycosyltransferase involved in cell wall biosynthesis